MLEARWYFDFISPFAYLQLRAMRALHARVRIAPVPMHEVPMRETADAMERLRNGGVTGRIILTNEA